ncbi:unnamed protein product [Ectocarpus sp. 13 AM-2016]
MGSVRASTCARLVRSRTCRILLDFPLSVLSKAPSPVNRCAIFFNVRRRRAGKLFGGSFWEATVTHTSKVTAASTKQPCGGFQNQCQSPLAQEGGLHREQWRSEAGEGRRERRSNDRTFNLQNLQNQQL